MTCTCWELPTPEVRLCVPCHRYFRNGNELASISRILDIWPEKPDFSAAREGVLENARERGSEVDLWFSRYLNEGLSEIPADSMREDSAALLVKLIRWWEKQPIQAARAQLILADEEIAGTLDIVPWSAVYDLKTTYNLEATYSLQVGGYCYLYQKVLKALPERCGIIHLTKRFAEPKLVPFDVATVVKEFTTVLEMYRLWQSKSAKRA